MEGSYTYIVNETVSIWRVCAKVSLQPHKGRFSPMSTGENQTSVAWFILLGLTDQEDLKGTLFGVFLMIYTVTLVGNLGIAALVYADPQLHTPMYFFLGVLSFLDFSYSTVDTPKLLISFLTTDGSISFGACITQMALMTLHATGECLLLTVMGYDRFVAICHPLLYHAIMSRRWCGQLVGAIVAASVANAAAQTGNVFRLPYCGPNVIDHYFCDLPTVLHLAVSYAWVLASVYKTRSPEARCKALSTCTSHLTAISLFYGTVIFMYVQPSSDGSVDRNKVISVFYTIVIPLLNPLIYSLRNREVKAALRRRFFSKLNL
ncbi:olfactory receptor 476-like [Tachyglossus aculeatus]|uniref:olfactory receptor 476-like n=1 Tax=Tachyglossus aculeatus TaxID=9261 RepID=UPI0018F69931|nr:olfactory receptor 476-like [Tachyglossus aculeatus]